VIGFAARRGKEGRGSIAIARQQVATVDWLAARARCPSPGPESRPNGGVGMAGGPPPTDEVGGEQILTALGYKQELSRSVSFLGTIALVVSDITPTASLLVIGPVVIATAGTGSIWAYLIGSFIAIMVALCMGELGSMYPVAVEFETALLSRSYSVMSARVTSAGAPARAKK